MTIDPAAITVLCYGDSNTHGAPDTEGARMPADRRWPGVLQELLGNGYRVIEEGLNGRTTDIDYPDRGGRNGRTYFGPCIESHHPLDVVVIMLGSNDVKTGFGRSAARIAEALAGYVSDVRELVTAASGAPTRVVLVSPVPLSDSRPLFAELTAGEFGADSVATSHALAGEIRRVARAAGATFVDAADAAAVGADGLHLDVESHRGLAALLARAVTAVAAPPTADVHR